MTNIAILIDALQKARAELAAYLAPGERNAELTIAKLVGILEHREVVRALQAQKAAPKSLVALQQPATPPRRSAA